MSSIIDLFELMLMLMLVMAAMFAGIIILPLFLFRLLGILLGAA